MQGEFGSYNAANKWAFKLDPILGKRTATKGIRSGGKYSKFCTKWQINFFRNYKWSFRNEN
jgi:hypothetical protein